MPSDAIAMAGPPRLATGPGTAEIIDRFRAALAARDIVAPENIMADVHAKVMFQTVRHGPQKPPESPYPRGIFFACRPRSRRSATAPG